MFLVSLWFVAAVTEDPQAIFRAAIAGAKENSKRSVNWLGREDVRQYNLKKNRKLQRWVTYEAMKLEGQTYFRVIGRNGKPLSTAETAKEQRRMEREVERIRAAKASGAKGRRTDNRYSVDLAQVLEFHDLRYSGEDKTAEGRAYWIIDSRLRADAPMPVERSDMALAGDTTLWIDQETKAPSRIELRFTRKLGVFDPGSLSLTEMFWNGELMLPRRIISRPVRAGVESEQIYSDYKRFGADVKLLTEPPQL